MPENDLFRRSLDAGMAFTQLTRKRAERLVKDLVAAGEVSREQAANRVDEVLERSRQNSELLLSIIRREIDNRIAQLNLASRDDLANLASRLGIPVPLRPARAKQAAPKAAPAKKAAKATKAAKVTTSAKKAAPAKKAAAKATKATKKAAKASGPSTGSPAASSPSPPAAPPRAPGAS